MQRGFTSHFPHCLQFAQKDSHENLFQLCRVGRQWDKSNPGPTESLPRTGHFPRGWMPHLGAAWRNEPLGVGWKHSSRAWNCNFVSTMFSKNCKTVPRPIWQYHNNYNFVKILSNWLTILSNSPEKEYSRNRRLNKAKDSTTQYLIMVSPPKISWTEHGKFW